MRSKLPLRGKAEPGEYLCTWLIPDANGEIRRIPGIMTLAGDRFPSGWGWGPNVPLKAVVDGMFTFPQRQHLPAVRAELSTGRVCTFLDAHVENWAPQRVNVTASAALVGDSFNASPDGPTCQATFQVTSLDAAAGARPIGEVSFPTNGKSDAPFTMKRNKDAALAWQGDQGDLRFEYTGRTNIGDGFQYKFDFVPVMSLELYESEPFEEFRDHWLIPMTKIIQVATGQSEKVTWLQVGGEDERGRHGEWQVFAPWISQVPFNSDTATVEGRNSAIRAKGDSDSLLTLVESWQKQEQALHPLIETFARDLQWLIDQPPRAQVLTICQAIEGWYNHENRDELARRREQHRQRYDDATSDIRAASVLPATREFVKKSLSKSPPSNLPQRLRWAADQLPGDMAGALSSLPIIKGQLSISAVSDWAEGLARIRNDLSHGNRAYPAHELAELAGPLVAYTRAATLLTLGVAKAAQERATKLERR